MGLPVGAALLAAALAILTCRAVAADMTATVLGEVGRPGTYVIGPGERLSSLLEEAGGFTDAASVRAAALTRTSATEAQETELRAIVGRIAAESRPTDDPRDRGDRERFLAALEGLSAAGRLPVRLAHPRLMKGTADDLAVEDGDVLTVPGDPGTVAVVGAVASPGAFPARAGAGYRDYVRSAGGATADAELKKAWLLAADGTVVPLKRPFVAWDPVDGRWEFTAFTADPAIPRAGDTIVVPRKAARLAWLEGIPDIDALVARIAILTGKVVVP